ncbi:BSD domain-containing protein 1 isoform X2 [Hypanus sabinus]|uniref:BSD domain-containing protein 1 isoform X2 n=1 Tax=Hypanus sabinus TaxID=79690 RepID=UPI0028C4CCE2|nr:BSD domain-containing protein 1 isoform X2 [Hypanus sabinus]
MLPVIKTTTQAAAKQQNPKGLIKKRPSNTQYAERTTPNCASIKVSKRRESSGSWWGSWIQESLQSVKEKSTEALEFMKRDLAEFSHVVQHDTACTIAATANAVKEKLSAETSTGAGQQVKKGLSNILGVLSDTFAPPPDKTIDCDVITLVATPSGTTELYDSTKARLYSLQADPATYCNEPDGPLELYDEWVAGFNLDDQKGEISNLLVNSPSVRALYTKMVPAAVSHLEFWHRYFYKLHQLEQEESRRIVLKQRAEQTSHSEDLRWEEEEDEFVGALSQTTDLHRMAVLPVQSPVLCSSTENSDELQSIDATDVRQLSLKDQPVTAEQSPVELQLKSQISTSSETSRSEDTVKEIAEDLGETTVAEQELKPKIPKTKDRLSTLAKDVNGSSSDEKTKDTDGMVPEAKMTVRMENAKEDGPVDLRVYELNSDSGKSTPSNNGKKEDIRRANEVSSFMKSSMDMPGSSTDISEDWEKDFDLDMTEEEVQLALSRVDVTDQLEDEDWEDWE